MGSLRRYPPETPLADFDWEWPKKIETREDLQSVFELGFIELKENVIIMGPSGLGKTTLLKNLVRQATLGGHKAVLIEAGELLFELQDAARSGTLRRSLDKFARPELLAIDEVGYLSYGQEHADLLFQLIAGRHNRVATAITTNKVFAEWTEVFPIATSLSALIDRLIERCILIQIDGTTYRGHLHQLNREKRKKESKGKKPN